MGSANFGNAYPETPLLRHASSLFSHALDDAPNVLGDPRASLGSMNLGSMSMDEILRNIWTVEESQAMASAMNPVEGLNRGLSTQFSLQKQGSLCLPRTLSTKAVEDVWKYIMVQHGNTEAAHSGVNHQRQVSLEDFLVKSAAVQERPLHGEVTLEDFLVKAGVVREGLPSNSVSYDQALMASGKPASVNQMQQVPTSQPSSYTHQMPVKPILVPSNQLYKGSTIQTLIPSNQVQQQAAPIPVHEQATPIQSTSMPSNRSQQQVSPIPVHPQASPIRSSPVPERAPSNQAFMGFGGFPISRNDGEFENKNGHTAPSCTNSFVPTAANALSCRPSSGKTRFEALNSMFLPGPGQQSDWMNNSHGKSIIPQDQLVHRQAVADAASARGSVSNASNGPCLESSPGRLSPLGGGFGAALGPGGTSRGGSPYPTRISFGPCSPLSSEFDEGSPETNNLPLSMMSEFGNGQLQRKKRGADPPVERVIERRQRRMIKNRESAARSRARKQAYTVELEAEVSQLKEENMELLRKQEEEAALRKKQILALMPSTPEIACKGRSLKRTHTGPW